MGLQAQLSATLTAGPASSSDSQFPGGTRTIPIGLTPSTKQYSVDAGNVFNLNSPSSYYAIPAVGSAGLVTKATTLYLKALQAVLVQLTCVNPAGGTYVAVVPVQGVVVWEYPVGSELVGVALQGTGQIEYWAAGTQ